MVVDPAVLTFELPRLLLLRESLTPLNVLQGYIDGQEASQFVSTKREVHTIVRRTELIDVVEVSRRIQLHTQSSRGVSGFDEVKVGIRCIHQTIVERTQREIEARIPLTEEVDGSLCLVAVASQDSLHWSPTTRRDGEGYLVILQDDDPLFLSLLIGRKDGSSRTIKSGTICRSRLRCGCLLSDHLRRVGWWRCLLGGIGLAEPSEPHEDGPDEQGSDECILIH